MTKNSGDFPLYSFRTKIVSYNAEEYIGGVLWLKI